MVHELGVWDVQTSEEVIPTEARWVVARYPDYVAPRPDVSAILDWYPLHEAYYPSWNPFRTVEDLRTVEQAFMTAPVENFWGTLFISTEHYKTHAWFNDDVDTTWFGERLLGYPLYLQDNPDVTEDEWRCEMFLRMLRGFYNYFHVRGVKVGVSASGGSLITNFRDNEWAKGIPHFWGDPALNFIRAYYDFVVVYTYAQNLQDFTDWSKQYFQLIDQLFPNQKKFWILTRIWSSNVDTWEPEAMALEMKNCFDRNIVVTSYTDYDPPRIWPMILKARELYNQRAPYTETPVPDTSLLTGVFGEKTFGWVANPEHDEGLYPTPMSPLGMLARAAVSAAAGTALILLFL